VLGVLYHLAKFGGSWTSHATRAAKNVELFVCTTIRLRDAIFSLIYRTETTTKKCKTEKVKK